MSRGKDCLRYRPQRLTQITKPGSVDALPGLLTFQTERESEWLTMIIAGWLLHVRVANQ